MICKQFVGNIIFKRGICLHPFEYRKSLYISIWPRDDALTSITISVLSGPVSNGNRRVLYIP